MAEQLKEFWNSCGGFIIGAVFGLILILCGIANFLVTIGIIVGFGLLGTYIQKNKSSVKKVLKNLIEKW